MRHKLMNAVLKARDGGKYSIEGFKAAFASELAFRIECIIGLFLLPVGLLLGRTAGERALLIACLFLTLIVELLNSAIETTLNRMSTEWHELTKKAKDIASAAVCLSMINVVFVYLLIGLARI